MVRAVVVPAVVLASVAASPARADRVSPPAPVAFVRGTIDRVVDVPLAGDRHLVLAELAHVAAGKPAGDPPPRTEVVPWRAEACAHVYAIVEGDAGAAAALRGRRVDGLVIPMDDHRAELWCAVRDGLAGVTPGFPPLDDLTAAGDAALPRLGALRDFFGATADLPSDGLDATPADDVIRSAIPASAAGLTFALERRMDFFAEDRYAWRTDPTYWDTVDRAVWAWDGEGLPDLSMMRLYWQLSPARAAASIRAHYAKDAPKAALVARASPPRAEAIALKLELGASERAAGRDPLLGLDFDGDERVADLLRAELARAAPDSPHAKFLRERLAALDERTGRGVHDAASLVRYLRGHDDDQVRFWGMYVTVTGMRNVGCDLAADLGGLEVRATVDCDAETLQRSFDTPAGWATASGVIASVYVGPSYTELRLRDAAETFGVAPPPDAGVATAAPPADAGATTAAPTPADAVPARGAPRARGGCGCAAPGANGDASALVVLVVGVWWRRRRAR